MSTKSLTIHDISSFELKNLAILADVLLSDDDELEYIDDHEMIGAVIAFLDQFLISVKWQQPDDSSRTGAKYLIERMKQVEAELTSHYIDGKKSERAAWGD